MEPGEPPQTGSRTAWWVWEAPATGTYTWQVAALEPFRLTVFGGDMDDLALLAMSSRTGAGIGGFLPGDGGRTLLARHRPAGRGGPGHCFSSRRSPSLGGQLRTTTTSPTPTPSGRHQRQPVRLHAFATTEATRSSRAMAIPLCGGFGRRQRTAGTASRSQTLIRQGCWRCTRTPPASINSVWWDEAVDC